MIVVTASPARTALKNSQLICGERHAYFGDRTLIVMQNRIDHTFASLRAKKQAGFMAYITGGDPTLQTTVDVALALADAGVDFLEIGVPFSDPLADGEANQLGAQRALAAGTTLPKLLRVVDKIRRNCLLPIILYSYLNPIFQYGLERFERDALEAGVDGLLLLDLPPDETLLADDKEKLIHRIRLVAPTTSVERMKRIVSEASGFVYYVSREGVTGERPKLVADIEEHVSQIRRATDLPIAVGFGISKPDQVAMVAEYADAVVVGSAIVRRIGQFAGKPDLPQRIKEFVQPLTNAVRGAV
jgi:tryptophan synthase alpha chain